MAAFEKMLQTPRTRNRVLMVFMLGSPPSGGRGRGDGITATVDRGLPDDAVSRGNPARFRFPGSIAAGLDLAARSGGERPCRFGRPLSRRLGRREGGKRTGG